jgi:hypothetical protein
MRPDLRVAALPLWCDVALRLKPFTPADRARRAHPKSFRGLAARKTTFNSIHHTAAKIEGQSFDHACQPPSPARILNQNRAHLGIPYDSFSSENALDSFFVKPDDIADIALMLTCQKPSAWTFELEARPFGETW